MKKKSSPRLRSFDYRGSYAYSLTSCTYMRESYFNSPEVVSEMIESLKNSANQYHFKIIAYTFMPDHLHLLLKGEDTSDLRGFIRHFKQMSGYDFKKRHGEPLWHLSYYDHILRKDEEIMAVARYILENPVRKGLVKEFRDYPFSGSFEYDVAEIL